MGSLDYFVITFYMGFMLSLGFVYRHFNKSASDYFRGGGGMIWPMVGVSGFVMTFSAWSFTGGAGKVYETGTFFLLLFLCNWFALLFAYFFTAHRFRQMRVITGVEAIRKRFGRVNEQVFTWLPVPMYLIMGGIGLYAISVFMSAVFGADIITVILTLGITATVMAILGGAWAISASDFLQLLTIVTVVCVMAFFTLLRPEVGGIGGLVAGLPSAHFDWTEILRPWVAIVFAATLFINQLVQMNSITAGAAKYVFVKNGKDARKATVVSLVGYLILPAVWMIPAAGSVMVFPNLAADYQQLNNPSEAAYVAMAIDILPAGMLGLLVCAIFAATMSTMDSGLNRSAGIIVRNFYLPIMNPEASDRRQLFLGKVVTGVLGGLMIISGIYFSRLQGLALFDLVLLAAASIGLPTAVPLFFGMFIRRTPAWAAWSTALVGLTASILLKIFLTPDLIQSVFGAQNPLTNQEINDLNLAIVTGALFTLCLGWFLGTMFFYRSANTGYEKESLDFFKEMHTPIDMRTEHAASAQSDSRQYRVLGKSCIVYGGFIAALAVLSESWTGVGSFLFCGGVIVGVGFVFVLIGRRIKVMAPENSSESVDADLSDDAQFGASGCESPDGSVVRPRPLR